MENLCDGATGLLSGTMLAQGKVSLRGIDLTIFAIYIVGTIAFGSYFFRRSRTPEAFTTAGRNMPGWMCGMSILATYVSSISFLANPGKTFQSNWNAFVFSLSLPVATFCALKFFVPLYRARGQVSAYSYLEDRFGIWARSYVSIFYLLTQLARMATVIYLMALPLSEIIDFPNALIWIIIVTGFSVTIYTVMGGIEAVIWNDTIQGILLIFGGGVTIAVIGFSMPEGWGQVFRVAGGENKFGLGPYDVDLTRRTFWVVLIYGIFINLQNFGIDQNYIQRYISARSDREAMKSAWIGSLSYIPVSMIFFFIGTSLFAYYQAQPELLPEGYLDPGKADRVYPYFIVTEFPVGLTGLLIAAVFAAAMSTVSTSLNSSATLVLTDYYRRFFRANASDRESMACLYVTSLILGIGATLIALAMINVKSALDVWWNLAGIFSGGMLGLFLLGYFVQRAGNVGAIVGVIVGVTVIGYMSLPGLLPEAISWPVPLHGFLTIVLGTTALFLVGLLVSIFIGAMTGRRASKEVQD